MEMAWDSIQRNGHRNEDENEMEDKRGRVEDPCHFLWIRIRRLNFMEFGS